MRYLKHIIMVVFAKLRSSLLCVQSKGNNVMQFKVWICLKHITMCYSFGCLSVWFFKTFEDSLLVELFQFGTLRTLKHKCFYVNRELPLKNRQRLHPGKMLKMPNSSQNQDGGWHFHFVNIMKTNRFYGS